MTGRVASILITDDDRNFRETLCGVFEPEGYRTLTAEDGMEALNIVRKYDVDLLLLDMHMPRLTGLETLRLVKKFRSRLPCILLSAHADEMLVEQALRADAFSCLAKPVSRQQITATVRLALYRAYNWPIIADAAQGVVSDLLNLWSSPDHRCVTDPLAELERLSGSHGSPGHTAPGHSAPGQEPPAATVR